MFKMEIFVWKLQQRTRWAPVSQPTVSSRLLSSGPSWKHKICEYHGIIRSVFVPQKYCICICSKINHINFHLSVNTWMKFSNMKTTPSLVPTSKPLISPEFYAKSNKVGLFCQKFLLSDEHLKHRDSIL